MVTPLGLLMRQGGETGISPQNDLSQPGEYVIQLSRPFRTTHKGRRR
jgi:hypothetical protein